MKLKSEIPVSPYDLGEDTSGRSGPSIQEEAWT